MSSNTFLYTNTPIHLILSCLHSGVNGHQECRSALFDSPKLPTLGGGDGLSSEDEQMALNDLIYRFEADDVSLYVSEGKNSAD